MVDWLRSNENLQQKCLVIEHWKRGLTSVMCHAEKSIPFAQVFGSKVSVVVVLIPSGRPQHLQHQTLDALFSVRTLFERSLFWHNGLDSPAKLKSIFAVFWNHLTTRPESVFEMVESRPACHAQVQSLCRIHRCVPTQGSNRIINLSQQLPGMWTDVESGRK